MPLTLPQLQTLKTAINADGALSGLPNTPDNSVVIAAAFNAIASPDYWVWRTTLARSDIYHQTGVGTDGSTASIWDWGVYKGQPVAEQNAWVQMFMGDSAPTSKLNFRDGVFNIFGGAAGTASGKQRIHILNVSRRKATRAEKLYAIAVVATGGLTPSVDNGNTVAQPRGSTLNPDVLVFEGLVFANDVSTARELP